jgi:hypothetical protein
MAKNRLELTRGELFVVIGILSTLAAMPLPAARPDMPFCI